MIYIESPWHDPCLNLAMEEILLTDFTDEVFMLWRNDKSVIVGKNQNTLAEVNLDYTRRHDIAVVRRLTGGGAVFHDLGNLNFSLIVANETGLFSDFARFTAPVTEVLRGYGVPAAFGGRNDLLIDGKKFSGNAQAVHRGRLLHHGTILFHTDFGNLTGALNVDAAKINDKGIRSVRSRVTNIWEHKRIDIDEFTTRLAAAVAAQPYALTAADHARARQLADEKYRTWDWNFGYSTKYGFHNQARFTGGGVEVFLDVADGVLRQVKIYGDFFARRPVVEVEDALAGVRHRREDIRTVLNRFPLDEYFLNITAEELLSCMGL